MHFEWDRSKADRNRRKHKVAFDEAVTVFHDRFLQCSMIQTARRPNADS